MPKKITKTDFAGVETNDPAFAQMLANLDNLPNIDIDPYASEKKSTSDVDSMSSVEADNKTTAKNTRRNAQKSSAKPSSQRAMTVMPISEQGRESINIAKQLYCKYEGKKMTREDFLLMMIEKSLKRLSPKAYERWLLFMDTDDED